MRTRPRIVVTGGRAYADRLRVYAELDRLNPSSIAHGGATGVDALAHLWAVERGVPRWVFEADWRGRGRSAGPARNRWMLDEAKPDLVLAFPGGHGTANCVAEARKRNIPVIEVPA